MTQETKTRNILLTELFQSFQSLGLSTQAQHSLNFSACSLQGDKLVDPILHSISNKRITADELILGSIQNKHSEALLLQMSRIPDWVDWQSIERGQIVFWKNASVIPFLLLHGSLTGGYSAPRLTQVLVRTGYLSNSQKNRQRVFETAVFLYDVMIKNGLKPFNQGWKTILTVRLMHGSVRYRQTSLDAQKSLRKREELPINQLDMLVTIFGFHMSIIGGLTKFGIYLTQQEQTDFTHLWRYVAYLMGVDEDINLLAQGEAVCASCFLDYVNQCKLFF